MRMCWLFKKPKKVRTDPDRMPNLEDMINKLSIIPQASHQLQQPTHGDPTIASSSTALDHRQEDIGQVLPRRRRRRNWNSTMACIGQDQAFKQVCAFLKDDEVGMVGIYGMGGVGKTTLMRKICDEYLKPSNFRVIWIVVSKSIDVDNIRNVIMKGMGLPSNLNEHPYQHAEQISKAFEENKVALLFDDIWARVDLEDLGILGPTELDTSIFKIIFTTRSEKVCNQMQPDEQIKVECLGWDDSWALFEKSVTRRTLESNHMIESIAKKVAKECNGLPLALTVIGRAMTCKYTSEEWELALTTIQGSSIEDPDTEEQLFARLKLSFDTLADREKKCFLYCCLFPEDKEIMGDKLIEYWIAEGILALNSSFLDVFKRGADIIGTLQAACLLERLGGKVVKMHDVIQDMGLWIASKLNWNFFIHGGSQLINSEINEKWRVAHRIYISKADGVPGQPLCSNLTTLIYKDHLTIKITSSFFHSMLKLRVLELWNVEFLDWEVGIGQLQELRYLSIHESNLSTLPTDIIKLSKLEVLDLVKNKHLTEFPEKTIRYLVELRKLTLHLVVLRKTTIVPCFDVLTVELGYLSKLEILHMRQYARYNNSFEREDVDSEAEHCDGVPVSKTKINYEEPQYDQDDLMNSLGRLCYSLRYLEMDKWPFPRPAELVTVLQHLDKLVNIKIVEIALPDVLIFTSLCLPRLETLQITCSLELEKIQVSPRAFENIREVKITRCYSLKCIVGLQHLRRTLVKLTIECGEMEELMEIDDDDEMKGGPAGVCFPNLKYMKLGYLDHLMNICSDAVLFPSLATFILWECPQLRKLPRGLMNEKRTLRECVIDGKREWWSRLTWHDDGFKSFIESTLTPDSRRRLIPFVPCSAIPMNFPLNLRRTMSI